MLLQLLTLAQTTPPSDTSGSIITGFVVAVIGAVGAAVANVAGKKAGRAETLKVEPQPLAVRMEEHFVTRREFDILRGEVTAGFTRAEALITRMAERVDVKHNELLATIERAAKTGTDGRVHLWNELRDEKDRVNAQFKEQAERVAKVETSIDLGQRLERGIEALTKKTPRG